MASVFLSYAREDAAKVRPLAQALEAAGHSVWWDQHISGGEQFAHAIEQALNDADAVVVVWSAASCNSPWVRDEAAAGRDTNRLVPVCLGGCIPPLGFRQFHAIDLEKWNGRANSKALDPLKQAIAAKAGSQGIRATPASVPIQRSRSQWLQGPRLALAAVTLFIIAASVLLVPRVGVFASSDSLSPKVVLGEFATNSPDLPPGMSRAMHDEIMAAFGAENAVAIVSGADSTGAGAAPFILEGSIGKTADTLRFTTSLKDRESGTILWTRAFDRAAADPRAVRQVSVAASQIVRCALWGAASYPKRMPEEGLRLYLQFCNEQWGGSSDDRQIFDAARRVTVALPDFSFGWSALALAAVPLSQGTSAEEGVIREEALEAARRATRLDKLNPEGYMAEAGLLPISRFGEREALLKKAISVRPTECGCERTAYGDFLTSVGRIEEAVEQYRRAQAMMPLSPAVSIRLAHALFVSGREDEAEQTVNQMLEIWPDAVSLRLVKLKSALWTRQYDKALAELKEPGLHLTTTQSEALEATFEALRTMDGAARAAAAAKLRSMATDVRRNDRLVVAGLAALGDEEAAIDAAQRLIRSRGHMAADVLFEPNMAAASRSARFRDLVSRLGLVDYWRRSENIPDLCRQQAKPGFCAAA